MGFAGVPDSHFLPHVHHLLLECLKAEFSSVIHVQGPRHGVGPPELVIASDQIVATWIMSGVRGPLSGLRVSTSYSLSTTPIYDQRKLCKDTDILSSIRVRRTTRSGLMLMLRTVAITMISWRAGRRFRVYSRLYSHFG